MPIDVRDLYDTKDRYSWYEYQPMLNAFGPIALQVDDDDYQGDSRVLYHEGERWGYLQFGWGSCSGCDALQECASIKEVQKLADGLETQIRWFENAKEALHFFQKHDWETDYSWGTEEQRQFVDRAIEMLEENARV